MICLGKPDSVTWTFTTCTRCSSCWTLPWRRYKRRGCTHRTLTVRNSLQETKFLANNFTARSSLRDFNLSLSRNWSLQTIEVTAQSVYGVLGAGLPGTTSRLLTRALSTITSPVFSEVIIIYRDHDFHGVRPLWLLDQDPLNPLCRVSQTDGGEGALRHRR